MLIKYRHLFAALLCIPIISFYAFGLTKDIDPILLTKYDSVIFDMDYVRVVEDWTTYGIDSRDALFHPLYKLYMVPQLALVRACLPNADPVTIVRILAIGYMTAFCMAVATISSRMAAKAPIFVYFVSLLLALSSFPVMLFSGIPDTTLISGLATLVPYLLLIRFKNKQVTILECAVWALSAVFGFGLTVTQVVHTFIAFAFRAVSAQSSHHTKMKHLTFFLLLCVFSFAVLIALQAVFFPTIHIDSSSLRFEDNFFSVRKLLSASHILSTFTQSLVYPFLAPASKYSPWYFNQFGGGYYLISMAPFRWVHVSALAFLAGAMVAPLWKAGVFSRSSNGNDPAVPMVLSVLAMVCLHVIYGREFIMYSSNWHGVVIVITVTAFVRATAQIRSYWLQISVNCTALVMIGLICWNNISAVYQAYSLADPSQILVKHQWDKSFIPETSE